MTHHVEQLRTLLSLVNPEQLSRYDYLALLSLARRIPHHENSGGGGVGSDSFRESCA